MKNNVFRPIDFWKSAFMTMPDNSFFELLRSVFGKIKTPFNKQQLLNDLERFLLRENIQKTITAYINENDAKIIAATALFREPALEQLESFFSDEYSPAQLQDIIVNLEERFIMYRFTQEKPGGGGLTGNHFAHLNSKITCLALNPVLENVLLPFISDFSSLFPPFKESALCETKNSSDTETQGEASGQSSQIILNDLILAGLISFSFQWGHFYKSENVIRKRVLAAGKTVFPGIDLQNTLGALKILGLFYTDEYKLIPDKKCIDEIALLSALKRSEYYAAALLIYNDTKPAEILPPLFRNRVRELVNLIHSFFASIKTDEPYFMESTLKRTVDFLKVQTGVQVNTKSLFNALEKTGLLTSVSPSVKQLGAIKLLNCDDSADYSQPVIAVDSGSSILVYPEIEFSDAIRLTSFLNIREAGEPYMEKLRKVSTSTTAASVSTVVNFELDKESAVRAFDRNLTADEIIELLKKLSGDKVDESMIWNLRDWEKRYKEISVKKGVILSLSEKHRYLIETRSLGRLIIETLAPGLYLLDEDAIEDAAAALQSAGIDIIARPSNYAKNSSDSFQLSRQPFYSYFLEPSVVCEAPIYQTVCENITPLENSSTLIANFQSILENIPMADSERTELSARINRRLVLCEAQLKEANIRYEKLEARTMDYAGKQNIAKLAISQQSPVEIVCLKQTGTGKKGASEEQQIFGTPKALEKTAGEIILVVDTKTNEGEETMRIPLAKIILLRRIKKSIFEK